MTTRKVVERPASARHIRARLKDEVYRQMFLLEENRPGAEMGLALALLRTCVAVESKPASSEEQDWLKRILPICLGMIEAALKELGTVQSCVS